MRDRKSNRKSSIPAPRPSRPAPVRGEADVRARIAARAPSAEQRASATTIALDERDAASVAAIMTKLPDPASLPAGALVIVPGAIAASGGRSFARTVLAALGRTKTVPRARRCSALVARGYVGVGAAEDDARADLAWGYAPNAPRPPASEEA